MSAFAPHISFGGAVARRQAKTSARAGAPHEVLFMVRRLCAVNADRGSRAIPNETDATSAHAHANRRTRRSRLPPSP